TEQTLAECPPQPLRNLLLITCPERTAAPAETAGAVRRGTGAAHGDWDKAVDRALGPGRRRVLGAAGTGGGAAQHHLLDLCRVPRLLRLGAVERHGGEPEQGRVSRLDGAALHPRRPADADGRHVAGSLHLRRRPLR